MDSEEKGKNGVTQSEPCNCEPGCCEPKKPAIWKKLIFIVLMLVVVIIIAFKLFQPQPVKPESCCPSGGNDTTKCASKSGTSDTTKPCCQK
jgi:hypothetical protein